MAVAAEHLNREDVLRVLADIESRGRATWTTSEIAKEMGENERRVRAAIGWLRLSGALVQVDTKTIPALPGKRSYSVAVYRLREGRPKVLPRLVRLGEERGSGVRTINDRPDPAAMCWLSRSWGKPSGRQAD